MHQNVTWPPVNIYTFKMIPNEKKILLIELRVCQQLPVVEWAWRRGGEKTGNGNREALGRRNAS